jgi:hypothetical protein
MRFFPFSITRKVVIYSLAAVIWVAALPRARATVYASQSDGSTMTWGSAYGFPQALMT